MKSEYNARLLIAEDESIIAKDLANTVQKLGYSVTGIVRNGVDVVLKASELQPDLILMDIHLDGDISGIEAAEKIRELYDIPVIYVTAFADDETLNLAKITEPFGYILKPFEERTLLSTIEMALYKHEVSLKLKERTRELESERVKTDNLLHNILPSPIVTELKESGFIKPREFESVTLLFTDFDGFTNQCALMPPQLLVDELNEMFMHFDEIIENYGLEKIKTIGDSYMVAGGLPVETKNHAVQIIKAGIDMMNYLDSRNSRCENVWKMRAGVNTGNVVAGVVGKNKYTYDVWGDTVNIASSMEKFSEIGKINITAATYELVKDVFYCEYRGRYQVKKSRLIESYFVAGYK